MPYASWSNHHNKNGHCKQEHTPNWYIPDFKSGEFQMMRIPIHRELYQDLKNDRSFEDFRLHHFPSE